MTVRAASRTKCKIALTSSAMNEASRIQIGVNELELGSGDSAEKSYKL